MVDTLTSLAVNMHTKKGAFALLIGSGVSSSSQLPTGWDIVLNLVKRIAALSGQNSGDHPEQWYQDKFASAPRYSDLLDALTETPAERNLIIRGFIEPNEEERDLDLKLPTDAHRAIADLVSRGYVRVVITTNFDRLQEIALADIGIVPSVIDSPEAILASLPLVHNQCTIIKLNGDYLDARIRNTAMELAEYGRDMSLLLQQVLYEYGLIVCGWSGEWDVALAETMRKVRGPWFGTFWSVRTTPKAPAQELIDSRDAKVITDMDADAFFQQLAERTRTLEEMDDPGGISSAVMKSTVKRFIDDPSKRIRLHDLVIGEANRVRRSLEAEALDSSYHIEPTQESIEARLQHYEQLSDVLRSVIATGCLWGTEDQRQNWKIIVERLAGLPLYTGSNYYDDWTKLRYYPALLALYAGGLASVASSNFSNLKVLLYDTTVRSHPSMETGPLLLEVKVGMMSDQAAKILVRNKLPHLVLPLRLREQERLWTSIQEFVADESRFREIFNRFEYLLGLAFVDLRLQNGRSAWGPPSFLPYLNSGIDLLQLKAKIDSELDFDKGSWPPLEAGLFGGSLGRLATAKSAFDELAVRGVY